MKTMKRLIALAMMIAMLGSFVYAAGEPADSALAFSVGGSIVTEVEFAGGAGDVLEIDIVSTVDEVIDTQNYFAVQYDMDYWTYTGCDFLEMDVEEMTPADLGSVANLRASDNSYIDVIPGQDDRMTVESGLVICTLKFTAKTADAADNSDNFKFDYEKGVNNPSLEAYYKKSQGGNQKLYYYGELDVTAPAAQKTPASFSNKTPEFKTYTANNKTYKNVWTGAYTVTANDDNVTGVEVYIKDALAGQFDIELAGGAADFEIAVIGKPDLDTTGIDVKAVVAAQ